MGTLTAKKSKSRAKGQRFAGAIGYRPVIFRSMSGSVREVTDSLADAFEIANSPNLTA
jgi:hypothetical protein